MALPLLLLGATVVGAALTTEHLNEQRRRKEMLRSGSDLPQPYEGDRPATEKMPSEILTSDVLVTPEPGAIVCCSVFAAFDHTGIWLGDDLICELHGSGLIKAVSVKRFLNKRSGNTLFVACDSIGRPLVIPDTDKRAGEQVFNYRQYDVIENNCYRFCWYCISGEEQKVSSFGGFNQLLAKRHGVKIYWDKARVGET